MKTCIECNEKKSFDDFYKNSTMRDGLFSKCKKCKNAMQKLWVLKNREKQRDNSKKWQLANPARVYELGRQWSLANPEKKRASSNKWRIANPEKVKTAYVKWVSENHEKKRETLQKWREENKARIAEWTKKWALNNQDKRRINEHNRRAKKCVNGSKLSQGLADRLYKLQRGKCACGCKQMLSENYHLDHIMPLALGGTNTDSNIQLLCQICNQQKHAKHPVDFMQSKGFLL